eukprot:14954480-Heterocapsa_arctica.AAC.1
MVTGTISALIDDKLSSRSDARLVLVLRELRRHSGMETTYLARAVPDECKDLSIDKFHLFFLNLKLQAAVFHNDFEDVQTTCNYTVNNFEVHRVAPLAYGHQDG